MGGHKKHVKLGVFLWLLDDRIFVSVVKIPTIHLCLLARVEKKFFRRFLVIPQVSSSPGYPVYLNYSMFEIPTISSSLSLVFKDPH